MPIHVLLIEDEAAIRDLIRHTLPTPEFLLIEALHVSQAEGRLQERIPDLMVVDWMLPGKSGMAFLGWVRAHPLYRHIPFIFLTARAEERFKLEGLAEGADDYLTKPFSPAELLARIRSALRRGKHYEDKRSLQFGAFQLNESAQFISVNGSLLTLRPMEYKLLRFFITHPNKVFSREQLLNFIWGRETYVDERTVDATVKRLREKLKPLGQAALLQTRRGLGYLFGEAHG